jgi:hypothetical protein
MHKQPIRFTTHRARSPLAPQDLNCSQTLIRQPFMNSPPSEPIRLKKTLTYSESTSNKHFINMSRKENVGPQGRPHFTFSAKSTRMANKPRNTNLNLNSSCNLEG